MKKFLYVFLCCLVVPVVFFLSCAKGDKGDTGAQGPAGADGGYIMIFQEGLAPYSGWTGCYDTRIADGTYANDNFGKAVNLVIGSASSSVTKMRFLIKFDLTGVIPNTVKVEKAYLTFYTGMIATGSFSVTAYPLTSSWDEGTAVSQADPDDGATWINRTSSLSWGQNGGDYSLSKPSNTVSVSSAINQPVTLELDTETVNSWITNPSTNYGVIIIGSKEGLIEDNYSSFYTKDYTADISRRPKLILFLKP